MIGSFCYIMKMIVLKCCLHAVLLGLMVSLMACDFGFDSDVDVKAGASFIEIHNDSLESVYYQIITSESSDGGWEPTCHEGNKVPPRDFVHLQIDNPMRNDDDHDDVQVNWWKKTRMHDEIVCENLDIHTVQVKMRRNYLKRFFANLHSTHTNSDSQPISEIEESVEYADQEEIPDYFASDDLLQLDGEQ